MQNLHQTNTGNCQLQANHRTVRIYTCMIHKQLDANLTIQGSH